MIDMPGLKYLAFEKREEVGILKFNNPKSLNALNAEMLTELRMFLHELKNDKTLRVLILTGEGKAFVAGADIKAMQQLSPQEAKEFSKLGNGVFRFIEKFPIPTIAAVNGFALGGGLELVLSADFAYASKNAKLGLPELTLGLIPGFGGCKRLSERVGLTQAKELIFSGRMITAEEAYKLGIINQVTEPDELMNTVMKTAQEIVAVSPYALKEAKELLNACSDSSGNEAVAIENNKFGLIFSHPDSKNGMLAFIEKSKPVWQEDK
jgi:enoyl-CoA hydratase